eukprot:4483179-Pyramimonas_sp.AAC.1
MQIVHISRCIVVWNADANGLAWRRGWARQGQCVLFTATSSAYPQGRRRNATHIIQSKCQRCTRPTIM